MNDELSMALRELEQSTDALLEIGAADVGKLCEALERRACAITRVASLAGQLGEEGSDTARRLTAALHKGNQVTRKVLSMKQAAIAEWNRINRIARSVKEDRPETARQIDYSA